MFTRGQTDPFGIVSGSCGVSIATAATVATLFTGNKFYNWITGDYKYSLLIE